MMNRKDLMALVNKEIILLDGSTGGELLKRGMPVGVCPEQWMIENEEEVIRLQKQYIKAGSQIVYAPTFTANRLKLREYGLEDKVKEINTRLVKITKKAVGSEAYVSGNLTITGQSIYPIGKYSFEDIVNVYKEQVEAILEAGVDLFVIETMISIQEARAALLAVKESCDLPVIVSMSFEKNGRTLNGTDPVAALITLQNLGADIVGCNCSTGPDDMLSIIQAMKPYAKVPLLVKPNAGLPKLINGETVFDMNSTTFTHHILKLIEAGASVVGGCCGTNPEYIQCIKEAIKDKQPNKIEQFQGSILSSERNYVKISDETGTIIVGERINPTGKKKLQAELKEENVDYIIKLAKEQIDQGAKILDVNVGMNGIDETAIMEQVVAHLSMAVSIPLCIDSSNVETIERALRVYPGRALVNSISLEEIKIKQLLPIAAKYGAMFILLPLSDSGLPKSQTEKHDIIEKVYSYARSHGFKKEDIIVDGLVTTVASNSKAALEVLDTVEWCSNTFGINTIMGLSNISFGLPERQFVNTAFLSMAITKGLTMAIANPSNTMFMNIKYATDLLKTKDKDGLEYIKNFSIKEKTSDKSLQRSIVYQAVLEGEKESILKNVELLLAEGLSPKEIVNDHIIKGITEVGNKFETKEYFLPQLIRSAETMEVAMEYLEPMLFENTQLDNVVKPKVIMATVKGDVHDIGKNLVVLMLKNHGFEVIDLGKDVDRELIIKTAKEQDVDIIGLSALMTTTMTEMKKVLNRVKEENIRAKVMIGGAVVTKTYAEEIGAYYSEDANEAVKVAKALLG